MPTHSFQPLGAPVAGFKGLDRVADVDPRLTRTHYFDGRLLTAEDLNRDQLYLDRRLREVGQTLGQGVLRGLDLRFDDSSGVLTLSPGLGISAAGRVLQLSRELTVDLGDRATITALNNGLRQRLERSLYAVVLGYTEFGTDVAEVFPRDLGARRDVNYDVITEAVQMKLVALAQPLPQQHPLHVRANLARALFGDGSGGGAVPEDAVALGVLAISNDRPQWLDVHLLRQPARALVQPGQLQQDLARHYEQLFRDVMSHRQSGSLGGDFAATEYFRLLPPVGPLPKAAVDPVNGRQGFFPESWRVWAAPVRRAELELIRRESMVLPPIDLAVDEPQDLIVLAPLSNADYGRFAPRLEREFNADTRRLPALDLLRLRLYPRQPVHQLDTDAGTWQGIWDTVAADDLVYIRRPLRAAETAISGIVLARGMTLPAAPPTDPAPTPADGEPLLQDEDSVFLGRVNFTRLAQLRQARDVEGEEALTAIDAEFGEQAAVVQGALDILLRIERRYDLLIWQTLLAVARAEVVSEFLQGVIAGQNADTATGQAVFETGTDLGLDSALLARWPELD